MAGLLTSAESITIGFKTDWGRQLDYPTLLIAESEHTFSVHLTQDLDEQLVAGQTVVVKASLPSSFVLFETEVISVARKPFAHAVLAAAEQERTRRLPRRQHFRVTACLPVAFTFERPGARIPEAVATLTAVTFDVSPGGVGILVNAGRDVVLPAEHTDGQLQLTLASAESAGGDPRALDTATVIRCDGRITRIEPVAASTNVRLGVGFRGISERQRTEVARFVIAHQLAMRRRGVLA
ncbi:MAG TPA: PilZ domain-containing protein [Kofleriaceae bacterium]|nr:PilZ domain-containing protein [Kofleriaceae bacterium]